MTETTVAVFLLKSDKVIFFATHRYIKHHDILQNKITFTIPTSTSNYTSKRSVHFTKKERCLACCAFLLDFCFSRMKKENSIKFCNYCKQEMVPRAISELFTNAN